MRRLSILVCLIAVVGAFAATQNGYVKTRGRLAPDGSLIPGTRLAGVTVKPSGRQAALSGPDGTFSFAVSGPFSIEYVSKQGYSPVDAEMMSRTFNPSSAPIVIVMDADGALRSDRLSAEGNIRRTLRRRLAERENELERLRADSAITEERYRTALRELYDNMEQNERLISDMAERFAASDYDLLDSLHRQVNALILAGELDRADSLIASRGNLDKRIAAYDADRAAIDERRQQLDSARALAMANLNRIADDCRSRHDIFLIRHNNDSAAYYIRLRASLDTTNLKWQRDAAATLKDYLADFDGALLHYRRALAILDATMPGDTVPDKAVLHNDIGLVLHLARRHEESLPEFEHALRIFTAVYGETSRQAATVNGNLAQAYLGLKRYSLVMEYAERSLALWEAVEGSQGPRYAAALNTVGAIYDELGMRSRALECYNRAVELLCPDEDLQNTDLALSLNNLGVASDKAGRYDEAAGYYLRALKIWTDIYSEYHPLVALALSNIAFTFYHQNRWEEGLDYHERAVASQRAVSAPHDATLTPMLHNLAVIHYQLDHYDRAEELYAEALEAWQAIQPRSFNHARTLLNRGLNLAMLERDDEAIAAVTEAHAIFCELYGPQSREALDAEEKLQGVHEIIEFRQPKVIHETNEDWYW